MYKLLVVCFITFLLVNCQADEKKENATVQITPEVALKAISVADNYAKQIILVCDNEAWLNRDSLLEWIIDFQPGGLSFNNWPTEGIQDLAKALDSSMAQKPLFFVDYFKQLDLDPYPIWSGNTLFRDSSFWRGFLALGANAIQFPESVFAQTSTNKYFQNLNSLVGLSPGYRVSFNNKSIEELKRLPAKLQKNDGILWLDSLRVDSLPYGQIKKALNWQGLIVAHPNSNHLNHLRAGADMVVVSDRKNLHPGIFKQTKKSIETYKRIKALIFSQPNKKYYQFSANALITATHLHFGAKSTAIFNKSRGVLPLKKWKVIQLNQFLDNNKTTHYVVILPENLSDTLIESIEKHKKAKANVYVFTNPEQFNQLKNLPNLIFTLAELEEDDELIKAQLQGKIAINGHLALNKKIVKGQKTSGSGLVDLPPEYAFVDSKILQKISGLVGSAINGDAFPGCQVFAIKNNVVIYNKAFGHTNVSKNETVNQNHLYDLASLTKALATTLVGMKLWEDGHFKLDDVLGDYLPDSLKEYLPNGSTLKNITFQELLTHKSGLPAGFPVINYMRKAANVQDRFMNGFCDYPYTNFQTEVAENLYLESSFQDSMWLTLNTLWLDPNKEFKYSDVNMNVLYFLFKHIINSKELVLTSENKENVFEKYLYENFYKPLKMNSTRYKPLRYFDKLQIVPTENDRFWRKQLLHGHVHDPNAALYGGIAGNAGLFSNATDMGNLLAMWQNKGVFEGKRYLNAETIEKFSMAQPNTHRGLGFNKRTFTNAAYAMADGADASSYGHTGFTGTCFWVDPVNKISYVFLSNRVHPKVSRKIYEFNIRKTIHEVFYDALLK